MNRVGYVIGSQANNVLIGLNEDSKVSIGDLLIVKEDNRVFLLKIIDLRLESSIPNPFLMQITENIEKVEETTELFFDRSIRFYKIGIAKILSIYEDSKSIPPRTIPKFFSEVYTFSKEYSYLISIEGEAKIGYLRSGIEVEKDIVVKIPLKNLISHHILVSAATGKGKSNFAKVLLANFMEIGEYSALVFDPHQEYYGKVYEKGLADHPKSYEKMVYFTPYPSLYKNSEKLEIYLEDLVPDDFLGIVDITETQYQILTLLHRFWEQNKEEAEKFSSTYMEFLLKRRPREITEIIKRKFNVSINITSITSLRRKLIHIFEMDPFDYKSLIFKIEKRKETSIFDKIIEYLKRKKVVIIDTSLIGYEAEKIVASSIVNRIFDYYRTKKQTNIEEWKSLPEVMILFEEAPRFLGKDVLEKGSNIFERIAREGRKFKVGLCAITQMPSLIPKEILSQLNTKIILGTPAPNDRKALIESAAHDISGEDKEIQMLDKGEAIITSPFIPIPIPVKIFLYSDYISNLKSEDLSIGFG